MELPEPGANDDEEDAYTPSSELRVQSKGTAGGVDRHARRRASVEAEQAALMVRSTCQPIVCQREHASARAARSPPVENPPVRQLGSDGPVECSTECL